jgi:hypothetical protein
MFFSKTICWSGLVCRLLPLSSSTLFWHCLRGSSAQQSEKRIPIISTEFYRINNRSLQSKHLFNYTRIYSDTRLKLSASAYQYYCWLFDQTGGPAVVSLLLQTCVKFQFSLVSSKILCRHVCLPCESTSYIIVSLRDLRKKTRQLVVFCSTGKFSTENYEFENKYL